MNLQANRSGTLGVDPMWHVVDLESGGLTYTLCRDTVHVHFRRGQRQVAAHVPPRCKMLIAAIKKAIDSAPTNQK